MDKTTTKNRNMLRQLLRHSSANKISMEKGTKIDEGVCLFVFCHAHVASKGAIDGTARCVVERLLDAIT